MSEKHIKSHINGTQPKNRSADRQATIVRYLELQGAYPNSGPDIRTREILDDVSDASRNLIKNLVQSGLVQEVRPSGSRSFIFHERRQERISGQDLGPALDEEVKRLMAHLRSDPEALQVAANALNVPSANVDSVLNQGGDIERMERLDKAVRAIERDPDVSKQGHQYGRIGFRRASNRYHLTPKGVQLIQK